MFVVVVADDVDDDKGQHQLTTFNHQSKVDVGGKTDDSGNVAHQFRGTISGEQHNTSTLLLLSSLLTYKPYKQHYSCTARPSFIH